MHGWPISDCKMMKQTSCLSLHHYSNVFSISQYDTEVGATPIGPTSIICRRTSFHRFRRFTNFWMCGVSHFQNTRFHILMVATWVGYIFWFRFPILSKFGDRWEASTQLCGALGSRINRDMSIGWFCFSICFEFVCPSIRNQFGSTSGPSCTCVG